MTDYPDQGFDFQAVREGARVRLTLTHVPTVRQQTSTLRVSLDVPLETLGGMRAAMKSI
jgi:hypothetical protein